MNYIEQEIVFKTESFYGQDVPLSVSSPLLRRLESTARPSVRMILEGTSGPVGAPPAWLSRASDIRTLGFSAKDGCSVLHVRAPKLGDAAPEIFEQQFLWPTAASPDDTALQVMGRIVTAVREREAGSDLYDQNLLKHLGAWGGVFKHDLRSVALPISSESQSRAAHIDKDVARSAQLLCGQTPSPRLVRVVGKLDMVRHSTRSFGLVLDGGDEIRGVLLNGNSEVLQNYFSQEITVLGRAIYRPSGTLLRLDASEILPTTEGRRAFSKVPQSLPLSLKSERRVPNQKAGVASFFGTWPGDESDRDLLDVLEEVRG